MPLSLENRIFQHFIEKGRYNIFLSRAPGRQKVALLCARPLREESFFASAASARAEEKCPFSCTYTHFCKENDIAQPNTDRVQRLSHGPERTHFSGPQLAVRGDTARRSTTYRLAIAGRTLLLSRPACRARPARDIRAKRKTGRPTKCARLCARSG